MHDASEHKTHTCPFSVARGIGRHKTRPLPPKVATHRSSHASIQSPMTTVITCLVLSLAQCDASTRLCTNPRLR